MLPLLDARACPIPGLGTGPDPRLIVTRRAVSDTASRGVEPILSTRTLPPRFIRRACPAVKFLSTFQSAGVQVIGGLFLRSRLARRCREMPLVLLASVPGMLGRGRVRSPEAEPTDDMRRVPVTEGAVKRLARRGLSFFAMWIALRSFRTSMRLDSESDPEPWKDILC